MPLDGDLYIESRRVDDVTGGWSPLVEVGHAIRLDKHRVVKEFSAPRFQDVGTGSSTTPFSLLDW